MELKYSVLLSVYSKEKPEYFHLALESMINQTAKPDEIIIVQDGPLPKDLYDTVWGYSERYPELIKIVVSEKNVGLGLALNLGLQHCRNNLVARMDTDDISKPERCEKQLYRFEIDSDLSICGTWIDEFIDDIDNPISTRKVPCEYKEIFEFGKRRSPFNHSTVMYKKSAVVSCDGYSNLRRNQDVDLFGRMLFQNYKALNIPESLLLFRTDDNLAKRRRSWENSKSYIQSISRLHGLGYSSLFDVLIVAIGQTAMLLLPIGIQKIVYKGLLRK
jgi:glycosyltransferase involved in cell wall biosynthesis